MTEDAWCLNEHSRSPCTKTIKEYSRLNAAYLLKCIFIQRNLILEYGRFWNKKVSKWYL